MPKFEVVITERLVKSVIVEADDDAVLTET